jgi:integrase
MAKHPPNLWLRHRTYFLRLSIPPSLRHHFSGRDKIVETLATDSLSEAERERDRRVAAYQARFERLRTGAPPTGEELDAVAKGEYDRTVATERLVRTFVGPRRVLPEERAWFNRLLDWSIEHQASAEIAEAAKKLGFTIEPGSSLYRELGRKIIEARMSGGGGGTLLTLTEDEAPTVPPTTAAAPFVPPASKGERFSEAFAAHVHELERTSTRATTIASYRQKAGVFQAWCKDAPLASITRAKAADFLAELGKTRKNATVNQYVALLGAVFECARRRGRFTGDNGFQKQKRKAEVESYEAFTDAELATLFGSATFEVSPKEHSTRTALPWAALIACYSGLRREEVAQLRVKDLREVDGVWAFDVTPDAGKLKTKGSARIVPVHSRLIAAGLLKYHAGLRDGRLFPGLKARKSKGGKLGAALGDAFEKWRKGLGLDRDGLCFHSFRHGLGEALERAAVSETDAARILGHDIPGMSFGTYSGGPGLKRLRDVVEQVRFQG